MSDYKKMAVRQRRWMYIIIALTLVGVMLSSDKTFMYGLLLGTGISYFNLWLLQNKTSILAESDQTEGFKKGFGTISRMAASVFGVIMAVRYDLSIAGYLIGMMTLYPVIMLDYLIFNRK